jgi:hypothetical protein
VDDDEPIEKIGKDSKVSVKTKWKIPKTKLIKKFEGKTKMLQSQCLEKCGCVKIRKEYDSRPNRHGIYDA